MRQPPARKTAWSIEADYTDSCCCQPTCPCLFGSSPTLGHCDGITLVEIESGHYGDVQLNGVEVLAVYRGGTWIKFFVTDEADAAQTEAAVKLLPTFEHFFAVENVLEVANVPISVERTADRMKISTPDTVAEIEVMRGKGPTASRRGSRRSRPVRDAGSAGRGVFGRTSRSPTLRTRARGAPRRAGA